VVFILDIGREDKDKEKENNYGKMVVVMKVIGKIIKLMVMVD